MVGDAPEFATLERLAASADIRDRAFVAGALALGGYPEGPVGALYERIREVALGRHTDVRRRIRDGSLDKQALVAELRAAPLDVRDHLVEEILDIAYPPPRETSPGGGTIHHCSSGLAEILFMLENARLGPGKTFVDLGSGRGKVVLLVALLTGARAFGVEIDRALLADARSAAGALGLDDACFIEGDLRDGPLPPADVFYMYSPAIESTPLVSRLEPFSAERTILLFSQALDLERLPWLKARGIASYWVEMYAGPECPEGRHLPPHTSSKRTFTGIGQR